MNLKNNHFLKIRKKRFSIDFEIIEIPAEKWKRPKRWHVEIPTMELTNRRTRESKIKRINYALQAVVFGIRK